MKQESDSGIDAIRNRIGGFLHWWVGELAGMVPAALKPPTPSSGDLLLVSFHGHGVRLSQRQASAWRQLGSYRDEATATEIASGLGKASAHKQTIIARLPATAVLCRRISLPLAAEKDLQQILSFQVDTLSPYPREQIHYTHRILEHNYSERKLEVELCLIPKTELERITDRMLSWGLMPDIVDFDQDEQLAEPTLNLMPERQVSGRPQGFLSRTNKLLLLINALLVTALVASQLSSRADSEAALQTRVDTLRLKADTTAKLRRKVEQLEAERTMLRDMKRDRQPVVALIDELSIILPDQTWLEKASYENNRIRLSGISSKASVLISGIESSELLENAAFQASVVQDDRSGGERFQISAEISKVISDAE